jgi:ADP-ribosylglycohydrolase
MSLPSDYIERVYAGVLGKIIGVYLGRPVEGWTYEKITERFGQIEHYVHDQLGLPLVVTDDDIAGTFTFLRALPDYGNSPDLTPEQVGRTWLNYIVENRTILWWGGLGNSAEHTAFLRLKNGTLPPRSGSIALNGPVIPQQIGAQIFIDGWAMVSPGEPDRAADFARRAASVSHDGEAVYAAQLLAAMEAQAFVSGDLNELIEVGLRQIPKDSLIYRLVNDLRDWRAGEEDWRVTREKVESHYGYHRFPGVCHVIPNHALIHLALLYGEDNFQTSLMIVNTSGWDTDCNSGNVGCLLGIKNGLKGIDGGVDWRRPVADRLYLSTADGGRAISDAVRETFEIVNIGRSLRGQEPLEPKAGARFHFELPDSLQGFHAQVEAQAIRATLENVPGHSQVGGRSLMLTLDSMRASEWVRMGTYTFIPPEAIHMPGYSLLASPTLYPGQKLHARIASDSDNRQAFSGRLYVKHYGEGDQIVISRGPGVAFEPAEAKDMEWAVPDLGGEPVFEVGVEIETENPATGRVYLDFLTWEGSPSVNLKKPAGSGSMWRRAWVNAVDIWDSHWPEAYRLIQNESAGLIMQGTREWQAYRAEAMITPHLVSATGIAVHVQGLKRYYALLLSRSGKLRLIKELDGRRVLAECEIDYEEEKAYSFCLQIRGGHIQAWLDGRLRFDIRDQENPLTGGGVALVCEEGCISCEQVLVQPADTVSNT